MELDEIIEISINKGIDIASKTLEIKPISWVYAKPSKSSSLALNRVVASFNSSHNVIVVNPHIDKVLKCDKEQLPALIIGYMAHEVYHAYQFMQKPDDILQSKNFENEEYLKQQIEIEAYSFQTAILRAILGRNVKLDIKTDEIVLKSIEEKAQSFTKKYKKRIIMALNEES